MKSAFAALPADFDVRRAAVRAVVPLLLQLSLMGVGMINRPLFLVPPPLRDEDGVWAQRRHPKRSAR